MTPDEAWAALWEAVGSGEPYSGIELRRMVEAAIRAEPRGPKSGFPQVDPDFAIRAEPPKPLDVDALAAFLHWYTGRQTDHTGPTCDACREDAREYAIRAEPQS